MIIDTLENAAQYEHLMAGLDQAFAFLRETDVARAELGRHALDGDRVYAIVQAYTPKPREEGVWEAHRRYADVQYIVSGRERMGVAPLARMTEQTPYDPEKDAAFYRGTGGGVPFEAGMFGLYLPQDAHMPGLVDESAEEVRKAVVKVRVD